MKKIYNNLKIKLKKYERYILPAMLILGVIIDFVTFRALKVETAFSILLIYLVIAGLLIAYTNFYKAKKISEDNKYLRLLYIFAPIALQFFFGALLSASLIFYWFSGAFSVSWPLILILAALMVLNEKIREYYLRPIVQLSVYYFVLFSILSVMLPFWLNSISFWIFILSGVMSLVIMYIFVSMLAKYLDGISWIYKKTKMLVLSIFLIMNILYFTNIIPPIPLAIRDAGIYHKVVRSGANYSVTAENETFSEKIVPGKVIHKKKGSAIYVFSSIFAPAELDTKIIHHWQYYDKESKKWLSKDKLSYSMSGGRQSGYRGYSLKLAVLEGKWRVDVQTERGQVLGRIKFRVEIIDEEIETETLLK